MDAGGVLENGQFLSVKQCLQCIDGQVVCCVQYT